MRAQLPGAASLSGGYKEALRIPPMLVVASDVLKGKWLSCLVTALGL